MWGTLVAVVTGLFMGRLVRRAQNNVRRYEAALLRSLETEHQLRQKLIRERSAREELEQRAASLRKVTTNE